MVVGPSWKPAEFLTNSLLFNRDCAYCGIAGLDETGLALCIKRWIADAIEAWNEDEDSLRKVAKTYARSYTRGFDPVVVDRTQASGLWTVGGLKCLRG